MDGATYCFGGLKIHVVDCVLDDFVVGDDAVEYYVDEQGEKRREERRREEKKREEKTSEETRRATQH